MVVYPQDLHIRARKLWQAGNSDAEIARLLGRVSRRTIRRWRRKEKWEKKEENKEKEENEQKQENEEDNMKIVRRAIKLLDKKISQGEVKGSLADLNRLVRLKSYLKKERIKRRGDPDRAMSDEQLDKEIKNTAQRIASLEREKAKAKKG
ncbi:hypothetical protein CEE39_05675 [bacterium (candidate division B38) B3_B38]|nr:MAG: hypothetical protein CEE39_05675 [bacterium (candidate division B38) B3_B38]